MQVVYSLLSISNICTRIFLFWTLVIGVHNESIIGQMRAGMKTAGLGSSVLSHDHNDLTREVILYVRNGWHTRQASMAGPPPSSAERIL